MNSMSRNMWRSKYTQRYNWKFSAEKNRYHGKRKGVHADDNHLPVKKKRTHEFHKKRNSDIIAEFEALLLKESCFVVLNLNNKKAWFEKLLNSSYSEQTIELLIKLLEKAVNCKTYLEGTVELLVLSFTNKTFCQNLLNLFSTVVDDDKVTKLLYSVSVVAEQFLKISPSNASSLISSLVMTFMGVLHTIKKKDVENLQKIEDILDRIHEEIKNNHNKFKVKAEINETLNSADPPNNFKTLALVPTKEDLNAVPFLRPNIIKGPYVNSHHYFDVQFRLLKEDFIRPLREGLKQFRKEKTRKNSDIRVYTEVTVHSVTTEGVDLIHYLKLNLHKNFRICNSKRFMYGNILCLSSDNFETITTASVQKKEKLHDHLLGVKVETEPDKLDLFKNYTVIESKAYFISYKHTLKALQEMELCPLADYIVNVNESESRPEYIKQNTRYVVKLCDTSSQDSSLPVAEKIESWPSCIAMGLDESQRRALYGALTRKMAIIQGPPGTGKTYLGLKIAKILLENKDKWSPLKRHPMLVVCYTNHALDQFLEGILTFTDKIIRIGSRSKNETVNKYQISKLEFTAEHYQYLEISKRYGQALYNLRSLNQKVLYFTEQLENLNKVGILNLKTFNQRNFCIIPYHLEKEICDAGMLKYLIDDFVDADEIGDFEVDEVQPSCSVQESHLEMNEHEEELRRAEENDRKIDDSDDEYFDRRNSEVNQNFCNPCIFFEVTSEQLKKKVSNLIKCMTSRQQGLRRENIREKRILRQKLKILQLKFNTVMNQNVIDNETAKNISSVAGLNLHERWQLYSHWVQQLRQKLINMKNHVEEEHKRAAELFSSVKNLKYLSLMKSADIVGMTTTGAAQHFNILHDLAPPIVIVEEAAEVLESHVVSSLTSSCQHLILIGDHKQLRPKINVYELGVKYNLATSLFERMINNGISYDTLEYQHRMKPEFSGLLVPTIYENLKDHPSVLKYPKIRGVKKDMFFLDHDHYDNSSSEDKESFENVFEAKFLLGLCRHLIHQGYTRNDITIVTPYLGQFLCFKQLLRKIEYYPCDGVRVSILDNFQGEESNIILLSLVRSNSEGKVGFVKSENRICVALSRAKHGMYVVGNMKQVFASNLLWQKIKQKLVSGETIGTKLQLHCQNHPDNEIFVSSYEEILQKSPEGGCDRACSQKLPECNHLCSKICHAFDSEHCLSKCSFPCERFCEQGHKCRKECFEICHPCETIVVKELPCGHEDNVKCGVNVYDFKCRTKVDKEFPDCKHKINVECYKKLSDVFCEIYCEAILNCGHKCIKKCHVQRDPNHEEYVCYRPCMRKPQNCSQDHKCKKNCYLVCDNCNEKVEKELECGHKVKNVPCSAPISEIFCKKDCQRRLPCGHKCRSTCGKPCGDCPVLVSKIKPDCKHELKVPCKTDPATVFCSKKCDLILPCGHRCKDRCSSPCTSKCEELVTSFKCPRGHEIYQSCYLWTQCSIEDIKFPCLGVIPLEESCTAVCGQLLECGHTCKGKCGKCYNGRLHGQCNEKCSKPLVCGHLCVHPCNDNCPPCLKSCLWKCPHSKCMEQCGYPCINCQEPCTRKCKHSKCTKKCGEKCDRFPCTFPCSEILKCGHQCIGYCGEPCPRLCIVCDESEVTAIFFGTEEDVGAKFVMLEDCLHVFEASGLEKWMKTSSSEIGMKKCPLCGVPIYNTRRFQSLILDSYEHVLKVKEKYFSLETNFDIDKLRNTLIGLQNWPPRLIDTLRAKIGYDSKFLLPSNKQNSINKKLFSLFEFQANFLKSAKSCVGKMEGKTARLQKLMNSVMKYTVSISDQAMREYACELGRLEIIIVLEKIRSKVSDGQIKDLLEQIYSVMNPTLRFNEEMETTVKKYLKDAEKRLGPLQISEYERVQIVKAMNLKQGHWFACPNGHVYCITECGGATHESKCPDCNATIGGYSHQIRSDNRLAPEMDRATTSAYPNCA